MPTPPFADADGTIAVRVGRLLDVESGSLVPERTVHIRDGRIAAIAGPDDGVPDGARRIDLSGLTVLPGLIDTHSHLIGEVQTAGVPATTTSARPGRAARRPPRARDGRGRVHDACATSARSARSSTSRSATRSTRGDVEGPRMQCAGAFITAPWGGGDVVGLAHDIQLPDDLRFGVVTSPAEVRERVRRLLIGGADLIKCIGTGAVLTRGGVPGAPELSEEELRTAVEEAAHYGEFVAVHAHGRGREAGDPGGCPLRRARVDASTTRRSRCSPTRAPTLGRPVRRRVGARARRGASGWPAETMRKLRDDDGDGIAAFRKAVERGVRIVYGTDSGVYPHELVAKQFA